MQVSFTMPANIREAALERYSATIQRQADAIFNNPVLVDKMFQREQAEANLDRIQGIVKACQQIEPVKIEGTDVKVNIYPVNELRFGKELGSLLGLISTASTALEDHQRTMLAYIGISPILAEKVRQALGSQPYFSKKSKLLVDGTIGNAEELKALVLEVSAAMQLGYVDTNTITQDELKLMYTKGKLKAETQQLMHEKLSMLSATEAMSHQYQE